VANDDSNLQPVRAQLTEPPYADPPVRWCGRGEQVTAPPIPIATSVPVVPVVPVQQPGGSQIEKDPRLGLVLATAKFGEVLHYGA